jgi:hypothetical protein
MVPTISPSWGSPPKRPANQPGTEPGARRALDKFELKNLIIGCHQPGAHCSEAHLNYLNSPFKFNHQQLLRDAYEDNDLQAVARHISVIDEDPFLLQFKSELLRIVKSRVRFSVLNLLLLRIVKSRVRFSVLLL